MKAMVPTFDLDLTAPGTSLDYARLSTQIDDLLRLRPA
jgi:hypothetical protein